MKNMIDNEDPLFMKFIKNQFIMKDPLKQNIGEKFQLNIIKDKLGIFISSKKRRFLNDGKIELKTNGKTKKWDGYIETENYKYVFSLKSTNGDGGDQDSIKKTELTNFIDNCSDFNDNTNIVGVIGLTGTFG